MREAPYAPPADMAVKWSALPDWNHAEIRRSSWSAKPVTGLHMALVSGDLARAVPNVPTFGLWSLAPADGPALIQIARDRALLVSPEPLTLALGWHDNCSISLASSAWQTFEISGDALADVIAEGTSALLHPGGPSAAILFAGVQVLLYRTAEATARLHVETGLAPYLWRWLETRVD